MPGFRRAQSYPKIGGSVRASRLVPGFRCAQSGVRRGRGWEADERPEPRSLGLLPSGPDPVGEWLAHRQPPGPYIGRSGWESKSSLPRLPRAHVTVGSRKIACCSLLSRRASLRKSHAVKVVCRHFPDAIRLDEPVREGHQVPRGVFFRRRQGQAEIKSSGGDLATGRHRAK
jgi:hypothetical protein